MFGELCYSLFWAFYSRRALRHAAQAAAYTAQRGTGWSVTVASAYNARAARSAALLATLNRIR